MIQNQNVYIVEKMIRQKHEELNRHVGFYRKQSGSMFDVALRLNETAPTLWNRWFKKRRLDTSWK
ncbi:hypothetical protein E5161_00280 [Cohnella pontilimi]|uniref:Uncharacterized protein n=1 Tax=Cohnella pontilimi TaxID=2564100 RepID=A0A4U0FG49_9BACL|nr:hypothetical protein [Cohnella pontilimi]TJY43885.1 hypothetical protein E5161_00280 [Cohnella pontilimi]